MAEKFVFGDDEIWVENGQVHREDGPAWVHGNGTVEYFIRGKLHKEDGPARTHSDGSKEFWFNGEYQGVERDGVFYPWKVK